MNGRMAKKLRKEARKMLRKWKRGADFTERVAIAWWLLFGK